MHPHHPHWHRRSLLGALYVSALHGLETFVGPEVHHGAVAQVGVLVDDVHVDGGSRDARALRSLLPVSLLGIAAGSALGPEAPLVQTGGVVGTYAGRFGRLGPDEVRVLAICGMASAFTVLEGVGSGPLITLPAAVDPSTGDLLWGAVAAVVGAGLAAVFTFAVGGFAASTLAAGLVAKLAGSAVCLATGWRGGFIIPLFFAGAAAGQLLHIAFPAADPTVLMAGCMVATNVGVTKTPLCSTLVVAKMAGQQLLPSTTLAAIGAMALTGQVNLIATQRERAPTRTGP